MIGHNNGPTMEPGHAWRTHAWGAARKALMPHLPIEILRGRLARAAELGLDYSTYAGIRATTGRDVVAVLFSSNALEMHRMAQVPAAIVAKLTHVSAQRIGLATAPLTPKAMLECPALDAAHTAPPPFAAFGVQRRAILDALGKTPADQAILVAAYGLETEWGSAARLAKTIPSGAYFPL